MLGKTRKPMSSRSWPVSTMSWAIGDSAVDAGDAHAADMHPGAGQQLEILGDAAVEQQALLGAFSDRRRTTASPIM
jgi:hypothetical protein